MLRITELEFDDYNMEELARHQIRPQEVLQLLENAFTVRRNRRDRSGQRQLIGRTNGGPFADDRPCRDAGADAVATRDRLGQHGRREEVDQMTKHEQGDWETEEVEVTKPVGTVISVRFPREIAERIFDLAERRGVPVSAVVREAVEAYLDGFVGGTPATTDITISSLGTVTLLTGHSSRGRTIGAPSAFDSRADYQLVLGT